MSISFATTAAWGLAVLVAFIGWGGALGVRLFGRRPIDIGLRAAWGTALAILAGGTASLFSLGSRGMIFIFVALGFGLAVVDALRHRPHRIDFGGIALHWKKRPGSALLLCICGLAALLQYAGSMCNLQFNPNDDFIAYFPFAEQILEQGTLFDPFSTRRAMSFGGHSFLHAMVLAGSASFRLHMLDQGICLLIALLLVLGSRTKGRSGLPALLALLILLTLPDIRVNTYSQMSGVVLFYALYRTLIWLDEVEPKKRWGGAILVALVASATCTLRSNFMAVCIPMVTFSYVHLVWKGGNARRQRLQEALSAAAFSVVFLAPWMLMSYRSSGTPLFPIVRGHFNDAFTILQSGGDWHQQLSDLVTTMTQNHLIPTLPLLFLAGILLPDRAPRKPLHTLLLSSAFGWILLVHTIARDTPSVERYVYGFVVAVVLAVTTRITIQPDESSRLRSTVVRVGRSMAAAGALGQVLLVSPSTVTNHELLIPRVIVHARLPIRAAQRTPAALHYRALQAQVPVGQPLLVMVDYPFLFDFARNGIFNVDTAAAVSPPPGFPYFEGAETVAQYLLGQSIRYVAFVVPRRSISLYRRDHWEGERANPDSIWHAQAPVYLDIFDNFEQLAATRKHLYDDGTLVLLDLSQPAVP